MTKKTTAPRTWMTLGTAELAAQAPAATADADLIASVTAEGINEPIYVTTTASGVRIVDGARRLAAAVAAGLTEVPVTYRPLIRVDALTVHPGNVRRDLQITKAFRASIEAEGVRIAVKVTRDASGLRIIDGHRRFAAAVELGISHVPYEYEERDEAGQMLDMVTTAVHREEITPAEEAAALFEAGQLGADTKRLAAASGRSQKEAKAMAKAGGSAAVAAVAKRRPGLTLDDMTALAELEASSPEAAARVGKLLADPHETPRWVIQTETARLKSTQAAAAHRAQLEAAGARIRTLAESSEKAARVSTLKGAGQHDTCQGNVWILEDAGDRRYVQYCTNPPLYGHQLSTNAEPKQSKGQRRAIITGGIHWDAAEEIRRTWVAELIGRKRQPKALADQFLAIAARVMLGGMHVMSDRLNGDKTNRYLRQFLGAKDELTRASLSGRADTTSRNPAHLFAVVAAAHEAYMPRTTWRTDGDHGRSGVRTPAALYLTWLTELGYEPTPIEAAVIAGETYNPAAAEAEEAPIKG